MKEAVTVKVAVFLKWKGVSDMKEKDNSFERYMRDDLTGEIVNIKEVLSNLIEVSRLVYDTHAEDKGIDMGMLGLSIYVQEKIKEELDIITELLETV